ncbi:MAG: metal ABC transporter permease [Phycisphaerae bacterium]
MEHFFTMFGLPLLASVLMLAMLGYLGIYVLKREIVFIDIAMAQTVVVGMVVGHLAFGVHLDSWAGYGCGVAVACVAAGFYAFARRRIHQIPLEAIIGISYAIAAAAALFLVGMAPGGHIHVQGMLAGSILWVTWEDIAASGVIFAVAGAAFWLFRRPFARLHRGYSQSVEGGTRLVGWDILWYALAGIVIAWATRIGGILLIFAFLIVPAVTSALFARRDGVRFVIGWGFGLMATLVGLLFADRLDFSVGPSIALFLVAGLALAAGSRVWPRPVTAIVSVVAVAGLIVLLGTGSRGLPVAPQTTDEQATVAGPTLPSSASPDASAEGGDGIERKIRAANSVNELQNLFAEVTDPQFRADIVCRALQLDFEGGRELARQFLDQEPPLFFRQRVLDALEAGDGSQKPTSAPVQNDRQAPPGL